MIEHMFLKTIVTLYYGHPLKANMYVEPFHHVLNSHPNLEP